MLTNLSRPMTNKQADSLEELIYNFRVIRAQISGISIAATDEAATSSRWLGADLPKQQDLFSGLRGNCRAQASPK